MPVSPYSRMARIVRQEKGLMERVKLIKIKTRGKNNPYYKINPSGRVPALMLDNGAVFEDSSLICWYLDNIDGVAKLHPPKGIDDLEHCRLEATARSMLDGTSLWGREYLYRRKESRSDLIMEHERMRALRLADVFENEVQNSVMSGPLNMAQITLACVLHGRQHNSPDGFLWRNGRPNLSAWVDRIGNIPSIRDNVSTPME